MPVEGAPRPGSKQMPQAVDLDLDKSELLLDPALNNSPQVTLVGDSSSFSSMHESNEVDPNLVHLEWNHTAGAPLSFKNSSELDSNTPDCNDFIYLLQTFEWPFDRLPAAAEYGVTYSLNFSGDFDANSIYFEWYVWLIDSSGQFTELYESYPTYRTYFRYQSGQLSWNQIQAAWGGMIEDNNGFQEDPEDTLTLAVGLVPTISFENLTDTLSGSVTLSISRISLTMISDPLTDFTTEPDRQGNASFVTEFTSYDIEVAPDGSVYLVGMSGIYGHYPYNLVLVKWDSLLRKIWTKSLSNPTDTAGLALTVGTDGTIYTVGIEEDMLLCAWSPQGSLIWKRTYPLVDSLGRTMSFTPRDICSVSNGVLYICGGCSNSSSQGTYPWATYSFLMKCDSTGNILWYQVQDARYGEARKVLASQNDSIILLEQYGAVSAWDSDGYALWNGSLIIASSMTLDNEDHLITSRSFLGGDLVSKWRADGTQVWNYTWGSYERQQYYRQGYFTLGIQTSNDNSIFTFGYSMENALPFVLKWSPNGTIVDGWAWQIEDWQMGYGDNFAVGSGEFIYVTGSIGSSSHGWRPVSVLAFSDPQFIPGVVASPIGPLILVGSVAAIATLMVIVIVEKQLIERVKLFDQFRTEQPKEIEPTQTDESSYPPEGHEDHY
jgi:hypothetical protein